MTRVQSAADTAAFVVERNSRRVILLLGSVLLLLLFIGGRQLISNLVGLIGDARGRARKYARKGQRGACILFMDEIDSIGMNRGATQGGAGGMGIASGMMMGGGTGLNTLLNQMDSLTDLIEDRLRYKILR